MAYYSETNPLNDFNTESQSIYDCSVFAHSFSTLFGEDMTAKNAQWCTNVNQGYLNPCWRRNNDTWGIDHKFAELSSDYAVNDLQPHWAGNGINGQYGAFWDTSRPMINILPITGDDASLNSVLTTLCNREPDGGYVGIYAGARLTLNQASDQSEINTIFNNCTG